MYFFSGYHSELRTPIYVERLVYTFAWGTAVNGVVELGRKYDIVKAAT